MSWLLALDGGGTRTRALVLSDEGKVAGCGTGGPSAFVAEGGKVVFESVAEAIKQAKPESFYEPPSHIVFCLGGGNLAEVKAAVGAVLPHSPITIVSELECALELAYTHGLKVVVLAGTGVIGAAETQKGKLACGGLGAFTGDEGGGFWLGWEAVRAVLRALDGRGPKTLLEEKLLLGSALRKAIPESDEEIRTLIAGPPSLGRRLVYRLIRAARAMNRHHIGALAPLVSKAAAEGDEVALTLLKIAGSEIARYALSLANQVEAAGETPEGCGFMGGVLQAGEPLVESLEHTIRQQKPQLAIHVLEYDLVLGAGLLALKQVQAAPVELEKKRAMLNEWRAEAAWPSIAPPEWTPPATGEFGPDSLAAEFGVIA